MPRDELACHRERGCRDLRPEDVDRVPSHGGNWRPPMVPNIFGKAGRSNRRKAAVVEPIETAPAGEEVGLICRLQESSVDNAAADDDGSVFTPVELEGLPTHRSGPMTLTPSHSASRLREMSTKPR